MPAVIKQRNATQVVVIEDGASTVYCVEPNGHVYVVDPNTGYTNPYPICERLQTHGKHLRTNAGDLLELIRSERKKDRDHVRRLTQKLAKTTKERDVPAHT